MLSTRFKIICEKLINSYSLMFGVFCVVILSISSLKNSTREIFEVCKVLLAPLYNFTVYLFKPSNSTTHVLLYVLINIISIIIISFGSFYAIRYIKRSFSYKRNVKKIFNTILLVAYVFFTLYYLYDSEFVIDKSCIAIVRVQEVLHNILMYKSVRFAPTLYFGVNFALRYVFWFAIVFFAIHIPSLIKYFFLDKVERNSIDNQANNAKINISRISKVFWDSNKNELHIKNIISILSIIGAVVLLITSFRGKNEIVEILDYLKEIFKAMLLWNDIETTPFSRPPQIAAVANIMLRVVIALFYIVETILCAYIIKHLWGWFGDKNKKLFFNRHLKQAAMITPFFPVALLIFYSAGLKNVDDKNISIWNPFTAIINITIVMLFIALFVYGLLTLFHYIKYSKNKYSNLPENKITYIGQLFVKLLTKVYNFFKEQISPLLETNDINNESTGKRVLIAASNFAAITSLLTTFVGLLLFFWEDVTTGNMLLRIINIIICFGFTAAIQYFLLVTGIYIGKRISAAVTCVEKDENNKVLWGKKFVKILSSVLLLFMYISVMLGSTLFSFSAFFAANAKICNYRGIVNDNVWHKTMEIVNETSTGIVNEYMENNRIIMEGTEKLFIKYSDYKTALNIWEDDNISVGNDHANTVDNLVMEYNEQMCGIEDYKNLFISVLLDDNNEYKIQNIETKLSYKDEKSVYTTLRSIKIVHPYEYTINLIDSENSPLSSRYSLTPSESTIQVLTKYQFTDILFREFVRKLVLTKNTVSNAEKLNEKLSDGNKYNGNKSTDLKLDNYIKKYTECINENKLIYMSFLAIRDIITQKMKGLSIIEEFDSFEQLQTYIGLYATHDIKDNDITSLETKVNRIIEVLNAYTKTDKQFDIAQNISEIGRYYNYAQSRNGNFSFAMDVVCGGKGGLNADSKDINSIYAHTPFTKILFMLSFIIDFISVLTGFLISVIFEKNEYKRYKSNSDGNHQIPI